MNDLAAAALRGTAGAAQALARHPMRAFGVAGFVLAAVVVVAAGQIAAHGPGRPPTSWLGLASAYSAGSSQHGPGVLLWAALLALVVLWLALVRTVRRRRQPLRRVWAVAGAWAAPFVIGPPFPGSGDSGIYRSVAFGRLARSGQDPYRTSPDTLGASRLVAAIDPASRGQSSSAGTFGTLLEHVLFSVSGGRVLVAVVLWRAVGVIVALLIGRAAVLSAASARSAGLVLCLPNPLVLIYVVSSPHLSSITAMLALGCAVAARRRSWPIAALLAALAGSVTPIGFVAVPVVLVAHLASVCGDAAAARTRRWTALGLDVAVVAAVVAVSRLAVPDGFGWWRTMYDQFDQHTPFAISDLVARILRPLLRGASYDDLSAGARLTTAFAALAVLAYLLVSGVVSAAGRARGPEATIGFALLACALLAPVLHPWYLVWGLLVFAPTASGMRRTWVLALSAAACVLTPPGFSTGTSYLLTGIALAVIAVITVLTLWRQDRRDRQEASAGIQRPPEISRTAGRTSAR